MSLTKTWFLIRIKNHVLIKNQNDSFWYIDYISAFRNLQTASIKNPSAYASKMATGSQGADRNA
ncbi:MAG: hypothetical protein CVU40_15980 [Chloroflexi bacterium HGW-Chloroflexi-2]|nr:MAG: hypothetical protein CVU40_15980 [Chloroflexi bacterium HGW-Chloroflexi-2]